MVPIPRYWYQAETSCENNHFEKLLKPTISIDSRADLAVRMNCSWALSGALVSLLLLLLSPLFANAVFVIPTVDFPSSGRLTASQLDFFRFALQTDGILAITDIPGFKEAREKALETLGNCYHAGSLSTEETLALILPDGTKRTTLAMGTQNNHEKSFGCQGLGDRLDKLQDIVASVTKVFVAALDEAIVVEEEKPLFTAMNNLSVISYPDFSAAITSGDHLDHFHVYEKLGSSGPFEDVEKKKEALETHTDQGLFIAIVPSISMRNGQVVRVDDGFEVELKGSGKLTKVEIPNDGASIVFMIGDGMVSWINKKVIRKVRPCPHRLLMNEKGVTRVWFGRMFFPPKDAFIAKQETTFSHLRLNSMQQGASNLDFAGCSSHRHILRDLTETACGAEEIYCWMACRSTSALQCSTGQTIECINHDTAQIWTDETQHCFSCSASCYGSSSGSNTSSPNATSSNNGLCNINIYPTNMYMDGFNGLGENIPCLVFLFQSWVMDTPVKYAFGSIGAFLVGVVVELLILLRRETKLPKISRTSNSRLVRALPDKASPRSQACMLISMYSVQLVLAYFAMLLAMSFAAIIFSMVMLGMICGHYAFNFHMPAGGNEACCTMNEDPHVRKVGAIETNSNDVSSNTDACCGNAPSDLRALGDDVENQNPEDMSSSSAAIVTVRDNGQAQGPALA